MNVNSVYEWNTQSCLRGYLPKKPNQQTTLIIPKIGLNNNQGMTMKILGKKTNQTKTMSHPDKRYEKNMKICISEKREMHLKWFGAARSLPGI